MKNNIMPRDTGHNPALPVLDTDLEIKGGGGEGEGCLQKNIFLPFGPQFGLKINGGGRTPWAPPLDPPLSLHDTNVSYLFE